MQKSRIDLLLEEIANEIKSAEEKNRELYAAAIDIEDEELSIRTQTESFKALRKMRGLKSSMDSFRSDLEKSGIALQSEFQEALRPELQIDLREKSSDIIAQSIVPENVSEFGKNDIPEADAVFIDHEHGSIELHEYLQEAGQEDQPPADDYIEEAVGGIIEQLSKTIEEINAINFDDIQKFEDTLEDEESFDEEDDEDEEIEESEESEEETDDSDIEIEETEEIEEIEIMQDDDSDDDDDDIEIEQVGSDDDDIEIEHEHRFDDSDNIIFKNEIESVSADDDDDDHFSDYVYPEPDLMIPDMVLTSLSNEPEPDSLVSRVQDLLIEPMREPEPEPVVESVIEPEPEPVIESVIEPVIELEPELEEILESLEAIVEPESQAELMPEVEKPVIEPQTEPVIESLVEELVIEPVAEPEPVIESVIEPEPVIESVIELEPVAEPEPVIESVIEPEPVAEPEPVIESVIEPEPVAEPEPEETEETEEIEETVLESLIVEPEPPSQPMPQPVAAPEKVTETFVDTATEQTVSVELKTTPAVPSSPGIYSNRTPESFMMFGRRVDVHNWSDMLVKVCEILILKSPYVVAQFDKYQDLNPLGICYFSYVQSDIKSIGRKLSNGLWVEINRTPDDTVMLCKKLLELCGYPRNELEIEFID